MGERDPDHSGEMTSMFTLESRLSSLNTVEMISAKKKFVPDEVNSTELMNCEQELALGMKSASQKSLINKYNEIFKEKEELIQFEK